MENKCTRDGKENREVRETTEREGNRGWTCSEEEEEEEVQTQAGE